MADGASPAAGGPAPPALRPFGGLPRYVVGAEVDHGQEPRAHAVGNIGELTPSRGMALCGLPAQNLILVPDLAWQEVGASSRCGPCARLAYADG